MTSSLSMGCGGDEANCKDGYALDSQGRCQVVDGETSAGTNTATTTQDRPQSASPRGRVIRVQVSSESIDVDGDPVSYSIAWTQNAVQWMRISRIPAGDTICSARLVLGDSGPARSRPTMEPPMDPGSASATVGSSFTGWGEQKVSLSKPTTCLSAKKPGAASAARWRPPATSTMTARWTSSSATTGGTTRDRCGCRKAYVFLGRTLALPVKSPSPTPPGSSGRDGTTRGRPRLLRRAGGQPICGGDWVGHSVSGGMDGDGDGIDDLLIVGYKSDVGGFNRGKIAFFSGGLLGEHGNGHSPTPS